MPNKTLALLVVLVLVAASSYFYLAQTRIHELSRDDTHIQSEPTNFSRIGTITVNSPGSGQGNMYFVYDEPGAPAMTRELVLDPLSYCASATGAVPCMAMSITFDIPFHGKRALVEGVMGTSSLLVRKLYIPPDGVEPRVEPGSVFISWPHARELLLTCDATMVLQTHLLDVYVTRKDGTRVRAVEPVIDEVFRVIDEARGRCGTIPVATE